MSHHAYDDIVILMDNGFVMFRFCVYVCYKHRYGLHSRIQEATLRVGMYRAYKVCNMYSTIYR